MIRLRAFLSAGSLVHSVVGALAALAIVFGVRTYGPEWETTISPVVRFERIDGFHRDEDKVCWVLHVTKLRWADAPHYEFYARPEQGPRIPTGAYLADVRNVISPIQQTSPHPVGDHWTRHYCFEIAGRIPDLQKMRIEGLVEHHRHPFWTTTTQIPRFDICPLGEPQDGDC